MLLNTTLKEGTVAEAHGKKKPRTRPFRRESDRFLYDLNESMHNSRTISESIRDIFISFGVAKFIVLKWSRSSSKRWLAKIGIDKLTKNYIKQNAKEIV